jgi:hypothetical protein
MRLGQPRGRQCLAVWETRRYRAPHQKEDGFGV